MRTLFKKAGFQTYLVDEFRTSCRCSKCEIGICKKTMVRENPKPFRSGNVLVHGLICLKTDAVIGIVIVTELKIFT